MCIDVTQKKIHVEKIKSSFLLKLKSKQLLEIAKTGVERAIEVIKDPGCTAKTFPDYFTRSIFPNVRTIKGELQCQKFEKECLYLPVMKEIG